MRGLWTSGTWDRQRAAWLSAGVRGVRRARSRLRLAGARVGIVAVLALLGGLLGAASAHAGGSGPPLNTAAPAISGTTKEGDTLTAKNGSWSGKTPISYAYAWERYEEGEWRAIEGATASKHVLEVQDVAKTLRVTVTASNSAGQAAATSAATEPIAAAPPKNQEAPSISPEEPEEGELIVAKAGKWEGTPATKYVFEWETCPKKCTVLLKQETTQESASYRVDSGLGAPLRVTVTDENPAGAKSATSAKTQPVKAGPPVDEEPPSIIGEAREGQSLQVDRGTWFGTPTIEYAYQWLGCGALGGCMPIPGATGASYTPKSAEVGETIEVTVTAKNAAGSTSLTTAPTAPVAGPPHNTAPPTISGEAREGETLTASEGTWTGTQPITYSYRWEHCEPHATCKEIEGAGDEASYVLRSGDVGDTIQVTVLARNSAEAPGTATSAQTAAVVGNPPKSIAPPTISGEALEGDTLSASAGTWSGSAPIAFSYRWERCSAAGACAATGGSNSTYTLTRADVGSTILVIVTATNAWGSPASAPSSATAQVQGNGEAVAWGENYHGQLGQLYRSNWELSPVPVSGVTGITQLAAGGSDDYALLNTGRLVAWGGNDSRENGDDEVLAAWEAGESHVTVEELKNEDPNEPVELTGVKQVATANEHALALMSDGTVKAWGSNAYGQLGDGVQGFEVQTNVNEAVARTVRWPVEPKSKETIELTGITAVAAGGGSDYALTEAKGEEGEVWAWGDDTVGQLGVKFTSHEEKPEECHTEVTHDGKFEACSEIPRKVWWTNPETGISEPLSHITAIYAGAWAGYAIREAKPGERELVAWGSNTSGQLGIGGETIHDKDVAPTYVERQNFNEPDTSERLSGVAEVAPGYDDALARLENGEIVGWGDAERHALTLATPAAELFKAEGADAQDDCKKPNTSKQEEKKQRDLKQKIEKEQEELAAAQRAGEKEKVEKLEKKIERAEAKVGEPSAFEFCLKKATPLPALESLGPEHLKAEQVSAGNYYGLALAQGKVFAWGSNGRGQQGNGEAPGEAENPEGGEGASEVGYALAEVHGFGPVVSVEAATGSHATVVLAANAATPNPVLTARPEHWEHPAITMEWEPETTNDVESLKPTRVAYKLSSRRGEAPIAEEGGGETGEGPPVNVVQPSIELEGEPLEEPPVVGEKLRAATGTWTGERAKFEYQWLRCQTTEGAERCEPITRWEARTPEGKETKKEHLELTEEEKKELEAKKPTTEWVRVAPTFPGHTVTQGDVHSTLEVEVIATNTEAEEGVSAVSSQTEEVVETLEEAEEKAERVTQLNCRTSTPPEQCSSPAHIRYTLEKYVLEGTKKKETREKLLVAEPYELRFSTQEEDGHGKTRVMIVLPFGAPAITGEPASATVQEGKEAAFRASSSGGPKPTVQWEVSSNGGASWSPVAGASSTSLVLTDVTHAQSGEEYRAVFSNAEGRAETTPATLTVEG